MNASPDAIARHPAAYPFPPGSSTPRQEALKSLLQACVRRVRSWRVPPNWSPLDWFEEVEGIEAIAAWQAECKYDATSGIQFAAFIYQRIMACALTRYRQEWIYALHFVSGENGGNMSLCGDSGGSPPAPPVSCPDCLPAHEELRELVATLAEPDRELITLLFWEGNTEAQIALKLRINQSTVSRRKAAVCKRLFGLLNAEKKRAVLRINRDASCNMVGKRNLKHRRTLFPFTKGITTI
jgi:DNA-directed RNA polymerase specialized sigma24 family protein